MKNWLRVIVITCLSSLAPAQQTEPGSATAKARVDFSGDWKLNTATTVFGPEEQYQSAILVDCSISF